MGNRDSDIIDLTGLTLVHKDTSNRTLFSDGFGANDGVIRERTRGGALKPTGVPCSCAIARVSTRRPDICSVCGGNADKRFHTPMDKLRERDPQAYRQALLAMGIPAATIDAALENDERDEAE